MDDNKMCLEKQPLSQELLKKNECLLAYCQLSVSGQLNLLDNPPRKNYYQI